MITNAAISDMFSLLSKLMDIHQENSFKSKSYGSAAFAIDKLALPLADMQRQQIGTLQGIGASTASKVIEILETGRLQALDEILAKTPQGVVEMLQIKGLGPKKISTIWKEMGVESIGELLYACQENRLLLYKGFGEKTQNNVAEAIEFFLRHQGHFLFAEVEDYAWNIQAMVVAAFPSHQCLHSGDFARQMPTLEFLEWVTDIPSTTMSAFLLSEGFNVTADTEGITSALGKEQIRIEFLHRSSDQWLQTLFNRNCAPDFLKSWQERFPSIPSGLKREEEIFSQLNLTFIPSYLREHSQVIDEINNLNPDAIIQPKDIRGIIHSHSDWSDGSESIEQMAVACMKQGFEYLVISDHSKSAFYANGLNEERIQAQHQQIDALNAKLAPFRIFKSIESDILNDGSLDYHDHLLNTFDLVIASVHSNLKMSEEKAMQRVLAAIENPYTTILGHPTGRLLLSRKGYPLDHEKIIEACVRHKVVIEINAHPRRLDLDWTWIRKAQEMGALLSINPDAHSTDGYADTRYGVLAAQKGALLKKNNLSSFTLAEFEAYLKLLKT